MIPVRLGANDAGDVAGCARRDVAAVEQAIKDFAADIGAGDPFEISPIVQVSAMELQQELEGYACGEYKADAIAVAVLADLLGHEPYYLATFRDRRTGEAGRFLAGTIARGRFSIVRLPQDDAAAAPASGPKSPRPSNPVALVSEDRSDGANR